MSYQEQAVRINEDLISFFNSPLQQLDNTQKEFIMNLVIQVGQVAKFRCRNNSAFDSFISLCFKDIAECKRTKANPTDDWETLRANINTKNYAPDLTCFVCKRDLYFGGNGIWKCPDEKCDSHLGDCD